MDGCSWLAPLQGGGIGGGTTSKRSSGYGPHHEQEEQDMAIRSQVQHQLKQICMLMDTEQHEHAAPVLSSSSTTLLSFSGSPDENSSLMLTAASRITTASCHHRAEVSSKQITLSPIAYGDRHHDQCYSNLGMIPNLEEFLCPEAQHNLAQLKNGHGSGAFRPYVRHLGPKKRLKPGAGGQRAIKSAMAVLARMHMANLAQRQCYQMEMAAAAAAPAGSNCNQLQHVLSERKRREKLNDSFKALRTVLPPAPKKDKASILLRARDYVNTLKSRISELEEKNRMLVESQLHRDDFRGDQDDDSSEKIEVDISRAAAEETSQEFHLNIVVRSGCNTMDAVVSILQHLKEIGDVRLVAVDTGSSSGLPPGKVFQQVAITLDLKSSRCDDNVRKESVLKIVKGVMQSEIVIS